MGARAALFGLGAALALAGCAQPNARLVRTADMTSAEADPWEPLNRRVWAFNRSADGSFVRPVAIGYRAVTPPAARRGIRNLFRNLQEPLHAANALLQGKPASAFRALDRFLVNGVLGVGGLADHATDMGLERRPHDFGQTLAVWGVPSGPYVVLPFLGPSTLRDGAGIVVDFVGDPLNVPERELLSFEERAIRLAVRLTDVRSRLVDQGEQLLLGAADDYAITRSAWLQLRRNELWDGEPPASAEDEEADDEVREWLDDLPPLPDEPPPDEPPPQGETPAP